MVVLCFKCNKVSYAFYQSVVKHWTGEGGTKQCTAARKFYSERGLSVEGELRHTGKILSCDDTEWKQLYGEGNCSVYVLVDEATRSIELYFGKTGEEVVARLVRTGHVRDNEVPYILSSGLSDDAAHELESSLLQCYDLGRCKVRNTQYPWSRDRKGKTSSELRTMAMGMVQDLFNRISSGEAKPVELKKLRKVVICQYTAPVASTAPVPTAPVPSKSTERVLELLPNKSNSQLVVLRQAIEREEQQRRTSTAESRKRARPDTKEGGGTPTGASKSRRQ